MTENQAATEEAAPAPVRESVIRLMVTEEMFDAKYPPGVRGQVPKYTVDQVAKFFFAKSASWLRLMMKPDEDHPDTYFVRDGLRMEFRRLDPGKSDSARVFTLADIEPMVWSLVRFGSVDPQGLGHVLRLVEAEAILYGLVTEVPADGDS